MTVVRLKIDLAGTVGDQAWRELVHFDPVLETRYGAEFGGNGPCRHAADAAHLQGEWRGAAIVLQTSLLAQYAVAHYLNQPRILDADVEQ